MTKYFGIFVATTAVFLAGCAGIGFDETHSWDEGWRKGAIVELGKSDDIAGKVATHCRQSAVSPSMNGRFATVKYRQNRRSASRTIPVSEDFALKVGDPVFVNKQDCHSPIELRQQ